MLQHPYQIHILLIRRSDFSILPKDGKSFSAKITRELNKAGWLVRVFYYEVCFSFGKNKCK